MGNFLFFWIVGCFGLCVVLATIHLLTAKKAGPKPMSLRDAPHVKPQEGFVDAAIRRWSMTMGALVILMIIAIPLLVMFVPDGHP